MRKIISKEDKANKIKRNQLFMGIFLIVIMVFSSIGFAFVNNSNTQNQQTSIEHAGIEYINNGDSWFFNHQGSDFITKYNPTELSDISFSNFNTIQNYKNKPLYFIGKSGEHFTELNRNLRDRFVLRIADACLENGDEECDENFPIKNCTDNLIVYKEAIDEEEEIYQEDNCFFIISSFANQSRYADALLFDLLGIR